MSWLYEQGSGEDGGAEVGCSVSDHSSGNDIKYEVMPNVTSWGAISWSCGQTGYVRADSLHVVVKLNASVTGVYHFHPALLRKIGSAENVCTTCLTFCAGLSYFAFVCNDELYLATCLPLGYAAPWHSSHSYCSDPPKINWCFSVRQELYLHQDRYYVYQVHLWVNLHEGQSFFWLTGRDWRPLGDRREKGVSWRALQTRTGLLVAGGSGTVA